MNRNWITPRLLLNILPCKNLRPLQNFFWSEIHLVLFLVNKTNKANNKLHQQQKLTLWYVVVLFRSHYWGCNIKLWSWCKYIMGLIPAPPWLVYSHLLSLNSVTHFTRVSIFLLMVIMIFAQYFVGFDAKLKVIKHILITKNVAAYCSQKTRNGR